MNLVNSILKTASHAANSLWDTLTQFDDSAERARQEKYLSQATSHAHLESLQRQWERGQAGAGYMGYRSH